MIESRVRTLLRRVRTEPFRARLETFLPFLTSPGKWAFLLALFSVLNYRGSPPELRAATNAALTISLTPKDQKPPGGITDLDAAPSSTEEGSALLIWTAPHENNNELPAASPVQNYTVRYATFSVPDLGNNTTAWFNSAADISGEPAPPLAAGNQETMMATGLEPGATIYFGIKSQDNSGKISILDLNAEYGPQAQAHILDLPPPFVTGLSVTEYSDSLKLEWSASTAADAANYRIYWDSNAPADVFTSTITLSAGTTYYTFANLTALNTYFFYLTVLDRGLPTYLGDVLESAPSATASGIPGNAALSAPTQLGAVSIATGTIVWQWRDNDTTENGFTIYSSTGGIMGTAAASAGSGGMAQFTELNLSPNGSYSRFVKSFNGLGESLASNTTSRYTLARPPINSTVANVESSSVTLSWSADGNPAGTMFVVEYGTAPGFAGALSRSLTGNSVNLTNLYSNATYYFRVRAENAETIATAFDNPVSTKTPSVGIRNLTATGADRSILLDWLDSTDFNNAGYFIYRTNDLAQPFNRLNATPHTTSYYLDQPLTNGVTYYYRMTSVDTLGEESAFSNIVSTRPFKPSTSRPQEPTGISGSLDSSGQFTLRWTPVTMDVTLSTRVELAGYSIYKSTAMEGPYDVRYYVSPSTNSWNSPDLVPPIVWYLVRARDTSDNESDPSLRIQTIAQQKVAVAAADETLHVVFPERVAKYFSAATNNRSEDMRMVVTRHQTEESGTTLTSYRIKAVGAVTGQEVEDLGITKPVVDMQFRYQNGTAGAYLPKGTILPSPSSFSYPYTQTDVGIFYNGGVEYVKFGGVVDVPRGTVSIKTAKPVGKYQVRQVTRATEFTLSGLTPRKIFTPNGDGINDDITLLLENPLDSIVSQAKIYDLTGAEVADFQIGVVAGQLGITSLKWDGRDRSGETARSGVYIYQIQAEGKVINGTIVIAR